MKVYVAGKYEERSRVRDLMTKVQTLGHEITFDWTQNDPEPPEHLTMEEYLEECAIEDADGVMDADILVLLVHPKLAGGFVELGFALGWNIPVIAVDRHLSNCVFLNMPTVRHARDEAQVLEWLGVADREWQTAPCDSCDDRGDL